MFLRTYFCLICMCLLFSDGRAGPQSTEAMESHPGLAESHLPASLAEISNSFALLACLFLLVGFLVFAVLQWRLKKKQLLVAKEIALERMKSRLFANIFHEIRTPLALILGPIDDMLGRHENARLSKYLKPMRRNASRLLELVNQLQELSRIESGKLKPELTKNDITFMVKGIGMSSASLARTKGVHLEILLNARADIDSRIKRLQCGASDYLTKPFVAKELLSQIHNLIPSRENLRHKHRQPTKPKPHEVSVNSVDERFLNRTMEVVETHMSDENFSVATLGAEMGMSRSQLHRKLKALIGQGPNQFIRSCRLSRAHDLLKVHAATSAEVAFAVGFSSPSYFTKCFHERYGYTPTDIPV